jgi:hypothetical protein
MSSMSNDFPTNAFVTVGAGGSEFPAAPQVTVSTQINGATVDSLEAAGILGITANNLRQIVHKKQLVPIGKAGRRTIFNRADVDALAARRKGASA